MCNVNYVCVSQPSCHNKMQHEAKEQLKCSCRHTFQFVGHSGPKTEAERKVQALAT